MKKKKDSDIDTENKATYRTDLRSSKKKSSLHQTIMNDTICN